MFFSWRGANTFPDPTELMSKNINVAFLVGIGINKVTNKVFVSYKMNISKR